MFGCNSPTPTTSNQNMVGLAIGTLSEELAVKCSYFLALLKIPIPFDNFLLMLSIWLFQFKFLSMKDFLSWKHALSFSLLC